MAELTPQGYVLKPQNQWFDEERDLYLSIDPNWNLEPSTPDGLKVAHDAEVFGALDEVIQQTYNAKDPNKAVGMDLDIIGSLTGSVRSEGTASTVPLTITGVPGTIVPIGTRYASSTTGTRWSIDQAVTLTAGTATTQATCTAPGPVQADPNTITVIVDVVGGMMAVNNATPATPGTDAQTDAEFRVERSTAVGRPGNNQIDSSLGELFAVPGVRRAKAYENDTGSDAVDPVDNPYGLPAHSMTYIVDGGTDPEVAMALYVKKNPGVRMNQSGTPVTVVVTSPNYPQNQKTIRFGRPFYIPMVVDIVLKDDGTLPSNIEVLIQEAFMEFTSGDLVPADVGFKIQGFDIGEDVPFSTLFTPINKVIGSYGNSYVQSMTVNGGTVIVDIDFNELSQWTTSNITVSVV